MAWAKPPRIGSNDLNLIPAEFGSSAGDLEAAALLYEHLSDACLLLEARYLPARPHPEPSTPSPLHREADLNPK